jgi:hypothetical protein
MQGIHVDQWPPYPLVKIIIKMNLAEQLLSEGQVDGLQFTGLVGSFHATLLLTVRFAS